MRTTAFIFMILAAMSAFAGPAVIWSGPDVKTLKPNIDLNGQSKILSGTVDPTATATSAPIGSIYLNSSTGISYRKLDAGSSTNWSNTAVSTLTAIAPTQQRFTSSSGTYTLPAGVAYIRVRLVGGGGGGAGSGTTGTGGTGGTGGNTTFGTSLLVGNGGQGGGQGANYSAGSGGTASLGTGPVGLALAGGPGGSGAGGPSQGGIGGSSPFGGQGPGGLGAIGGGSAATANTGSGGGGGGGNSGVNAGAGGSGGGYVDAFISSPLATYSYAVGAAGTAGTAGTSGSVGAAGGSGYIEVTEYYGASGSVLNPANALDVLGQVNYVLGSTCPAGSIAADGSAISRTTYAQLFARISTTYGVGNGSTTFNVPDLRGIFVRGAGTNGTLTNANGVAYSGTLAATQNDQMQGHLHPQTVENTFRTTSGSGLLVPYSGNVAAQSGFTGSPSADGSNGTPRTGVETRPANMSLTPCISNATMAMPVIANSVTSSSAGVERLERVEVTSACTSTPCTIASQSGSWLTSITRSSTGVYVLNFATAFSSPPTCRPTAVVGNNTNIFLNALTTTTTATIGVQTATSAAYADSAFNVTCMGPK